MGFFDDVHGFLKDYTPEGVIERAITGEKDYSKNPVLWPSEWVTKEVIPVEYKDGKFDTKKPEFITDITKIGNTVIDDIEIAGSWVKTKTSAFIDEVEVVFDDTKKILVAVFNIFEKVGIPIITWIGDHPTLVIYGIVGFTGLKVANEVKQVMK